MLRYLLIYFLIIPSYRDSVEVADSFPRPIPMVMAPELFIPSERLFGYEPWHYAPITRPVEHFLDIYGFNGSVGFGGYVQEHPEKFFSTLEGYNLFDVPHLYVSQQMMIGNTLKLGKRVYFMSGILYGSQLGVQANNWGMGTREGIIWYPTPLVSIVFWSQYFQSVEVYSPVLFPDKTGSSAAKRMPATPEVFSFGVQASFVVGEFIIGVGTTVAPVPFSKRHHSKFYLK